MSSTAADSNACVSILHGLYRKPRLLTFRFTGIVKRLLDALKAEPMSEDIMPHFLTAFESLVKCNFNAEAHRNSALFITYTFHSTVNSNARTSRASSGTATPNGPLGSSLRLRRSTVDSVHGSGVKILTKKQVGVKILELYTRLLCEKGNYTDIHKFARTVTNKVSDGSDSYRETTLM